MKKSIYSILIASSLLFLLLHNTQIHSKLFVNPTIGDQIACLLKKLGYTLDENRHSIGEIVNTPQTISGPGFYVLGADIAGSIIIDEDNVYLDLNGYTIDPTGSTGITVNTKQNILIKNGSITNAYDGILIQDGSQYVHIDNVHISDSEHGIHFAGTPELYIKSCEVTNCEFMKNNKAAYFTHTIKSLFKNCSALNCYEVGFDLHSSKYNCFDTCKVLETLNDVAEKGAYGFASTSGEGNLFIECVSSGLKKTSSNFCKKVTGFLLNATNTEAGESGTKIFNCIASDLESSEYGNAYGIHLNAVLKSSILSEPIANIGSTQDKKRGISWSPESKFIGVCGPSNLSVLRFDNSGLTKVANRSSANALSLDFSPRGDFLAVGKTSGSKLAVYAFDPYQYDASSRLILKDEKNIGDDVYAVEFCYCGKFLAIGAGAAESNEFQIWEFDGSNLTSVASNNPGSTVYDVSFSPDGKYVAAVFDDKIRIFQFNPKSSSPLALMLTQQAYGGTLKAVDWSPIACSKYLLAVGGTVSNSKTIQTFLYDPITDDSALAPLATENHGATVEDIKWSPNGKYLLSCGSSSGDYEIRIYECAISPNALTIKWSGSFPVSGAEGYGCDWDKSGKYIVSTGNKSSSPYNDSTAIFEVANAPTRCLVENNCVFNIVGGLCGIGIEGASGSSLIIRNIGYENNINFSSGVYNTFTGGLNGTPTELENLSVPPYEN